VPGFLRRSYTRAIGAEVVEVTEVAMESLPIVIEPLQGTKMRTFRKFIEEVDSQTPSYNIDSDASSFEWQKEEGPVHAADVVICKQDATPLQVIEQFDLEICKARFNGESFFIPNPQLTFRTHDAMAKPGQFIHSPATTIARNKDVLTTFFQEPFKSTSTYDRLLYLERNCKNPNEAHPFLKFMQSQGFGFGKTENIVIRTNDRNDIWKIDTNEEESKTIIRKIHNVVQSSVSRFNKYNCRRIQVLEMPPALHHPPFKRNFHNKTLYILKPF